MHVFVTGATGWIGTAIVDELLSAGHHVTGLARSMKKAEHLVAAGGKVIQASLDELDILREAASAADAVVHTAFNHDFIQSANGFSKFLESAAQDERVIEILGGALEGSSRPLLVTSGLSGLPRGVTEKRILRTRPARASRKPQQERLPPGACARQLCGSPRQFTGSANTALFRCWSSWRARLAFRPISTRGKTAGRVFIGWMQRAFTGLPWSRA